MGCCGGGRGGIESDIRAKAPAGLPGASGFPEAPGPFPEIPAREGKVPVSDIWALENTEAQEGEKPCLVPLLPAPR